MSLSEGTAFTFTQQQIDLPLVLKLMKKLSGQVCLFKVFYVCISHLVDLKKRI